MPKGSMLDPRWRRLASVRHCCNASCIASVFAGSVVLLGWLFRIQPLKSAFLDSVTIKTNTSLGLIFLGISLWLLLPDPPQRSRRHWGLLLAAFAATIGALTVIEHVLALDLHVDQILFKDHGGVGPIYAPGRMPPITAATFLALGLALLLLDSETRNKWRPAQALCLWGGFAGIMSLSGYIDGAKAVFRTFSFERADVFIALLLFMMSAAILFARPRVGIAGDLTGALLGSTMARRFLPVVILVPLIGAWVRTQLQRAGFFEAELGLALSVTISVITLVVLLWLNAQQLNATEESLEEARKAKDAFYLASLRDELTGLYNRRGFLAFAEEQIKLACSGRRELLVVFADVDGLKTINDKYGHPEGDRALKKAADVLTTVFRDTDLIARLGGDEFVVLALDCSPAGMARINAHFEKMLRLVNRHSDPWELSISVGALHIDSEHQLCLDDLLSKADAIMYRHKRAALVPAVG